MKISVVIPLFNKRKTILNTLDSVFRQTYPPFEIVIINDGSTDGSEKLVYESKNPILKIFNQPNKGVSAARNEGINKSNGDWIAFLDADDIWKDNYLETISFLHTSFPECEVLATSYEFESYNGVKKASVVKRLMFKNDYGILKNYFEVASCSNPPLWTSALVVKKSALLDIGGFPSGVNAGEDLITWAKLAVKYKIAYSNKILAVFVLDRVHSVSEKPGRLPDANDFVGNELLRLKTSSDGKIKSDIGKYISLWYKMKASAFLRNGEFRNVWLNGCKSLKYNLFNYKVYLFLLMTFLPLKVRKSIARLYSE